MSVSVKSEQNYIFEADWKLKWNVLEFSKYTIL